MKGLWLLGAAGCVALTLTACGDGQGARTPADVLSDVAVDAASEVSDEDSEGAVDIVSDTSEVSVDADISGTTGCLAAEAPDTAGTESWHDPLGSATVTIADRDTCTRTYGLSSTALLRDAAWPNPRIIRETPELPVLRSGHDVFDALYALAMLEVTENAVDSVSDGAFNEGVSVPCGDGGCFETGRLWNYVWTRDIAYAVDLGLAGLDPRRSENSLRFKLSERRTGGDLQIVQDTGTGGSWPVSTDRVAWALGAEALLNQLPTESRAGFAATTLTALRNTLAHDRATVFDPSDGLYTGETSFLDWREQTYPEWTTTDVVHIGMSKALSTNILHLHALRLAARLAREAGEGDEAARFGREATDLRAAIHAAFWLEDAGLFASYLTTTLDPSPVRRFDLLGSALAVLLDVANEVEEVRILANYPHAGAAASVIWPQQQQTPIYHNRGQWPFVTAYWLRAAARAGNDAVAERMIRALIRGAAMNLSHMENFEVLSGAPFVADGDASGPVVNSERQLWSVAGYISAIHHTLFGLHPTSECLDISPFIPSTLRSTLFAGARELTLYGYVWQGLRMDVTLRLPENAGTGSLRVGSVHLNGSVLATQLITRDLLTGTDRVVIELLAGDSSSSLRAIAPDDWRAFYGPMPPRITGLEADQGRVTLSLATAQARDVSFSVYRDGLRIAEGLVGTTDRWTDPDFDANSARTPCYTVVTYFPSSGNASQHSPPVCWWGPGNARVKSVSIEDFTHVGGTAATTADRFHYEAWGDEDHSLTSPDFVATQSGPVLFQLVYGNGAGAVSTGITAAYKRLRVLDAVSGDSVVRGYVLMPHLGDWSLWADSSFVPAALEAGKTYRVVIDGDALSVNMSFFKHFESYTGGLGGRDGSFNRVNITALKVLYR